MSLSDEQISQLAARIGKELTKENSLLATKKDVQAITRDVQRIEHNVQRIDYKVQRIEDKVQRIEHKVQRIEDKVQRIEHKVQRIEHNVEALVRNIPNVALKSVAPFVINKGTELEDRAIAKGADSTWTYMRHGDKLLAVSAAHCATHPLDWGDSQPPAKKQKGSKTKKNARGPAQGKDTWHFCEVPLVLAPFVKSAYFLPRVIGEKWEGVPTERDIVALELDQQKMPLVGNLLENKSVLNWRTVAGQHHQINLQNCSLAGVGLASIVHAPSCAWDRHKKYIVFNPDNSEEGHSGTVMIDLSQRDTQLCDQAVGVFIGEVARDGLKPRSEVCLLPDFSNLIEYKVVATPPSSEIKFNLLFLEERKRSKELIQFRTTFKRVSGTDHEYREESSSGSRTVYGVFVAPPASP